MGVDIFGLNPKNERGNSFCSNWWGWRPIWAFTVILCRDILDKKFRNGDTEYFGWEVGHSNDGFEIPADEAEEIGKRIIEVLSPSEDVAEEVADRIKGGLAEEIAREVRTYLNPEHYTLDMGLLKEWAEFCLNCGGFAVC